MPINLQVIKPILVWFTEYEQLCRLPVERTIKAFLCKGGAMTEGGRRR